MATTRKAPAKEGRPAAKSPAPEAAAKNRELSVLAEAHARMGTRARVLERLLHLFSDVERLYWNLEAVLDAALEAVPAEAGSVLLLDADAQVLQFVAARGPVGPRLMGLRLALDEGLAGDCARQKKPLAVSDVQQDPRFAREISETLGFDTRSLLAAPMINRGEVLGVIEIVNRKDGDVFARHEVELLDRIARAAGSLARLGFTAGARLPQGQGAESGPAGPS